MNDWLFVQNYRTLWMKHFGWKLDKDSDLTVLKAEQARLLMTPERIAEYNAERGRAK